MVEKKLKYWADIDYPPLNLWNCPSWLVPRESTKVATATVKFRNPVTTNEAYQKCKSNR